MPDVDVNCVGEASILIIDIKKVVSYVIVTHIDVWPSILVDISHRNSQAITLVYNSCFLRYICKRTVAIIPVKPVRIQCRAIVYLRTITGWNTSFDRVGKNIQIKVAVIVIIEERSSGAVTVIIKTIGSA